MRLTSNLKGKAFNFTLVQAGDHESLAVYTDAEGNLFTVDDSFLGYFDDNGNELLVHTVDQGPGEPELHVFEWVDGDLVPEEVADFLGDFTDVDGNEFAGVPARYVHDVSSSLAVTPNYDFSEEVANELLSLAQFGNLIFVVPE